MHCNSLNFAVNITKCNCK